MVIAPPAAMHITSTQVVLRLAVAVLLGGWLGTNGRFKRRHSMTFRALTYIGVCCFSSVLMMSCLYGWDLVSNAASEMLHSMSSHAYGVVVSCICFVSGWMLFGFVVPARNPEEPARLFIAMVIGFCAGDGFYTCAFLCAFIVMLIANLPMWIKSDKR